MTPWEEQEERIDAAVWKRPRRHFIFDPPFHPECVPEPFVNFKLNFRD